MHFPRKNTGFFFCGLAFARPGDKYFLVGEDAKKRAGFFYFGTFKTLTFRGGNLMVCFTISTVPSLKNILPNID